MRRRGINKLRTISTATITGSRRLRFSSMWQRLRANLRRRRVKSCARS
jgi:hypothetical protein